MKTAFLITILLVALFAGVYMIGCSGGIDSIFSSMPEDWAGTTWVYPENANSTSPPESVWTFEKKKMEFTANQVDASGAVTASVAIPINKIKKDEQSDNGTVWTVTAEDGNGKEYRFFDITSDSFKYMVPNDTKLTLVDGSGETIIFTEAPIEAEYTKQGNQ